MNLLLSLKQISYLRSVKRWIKLRQRILVDFLKVKWLMTLYFNFKMFDFKTAKKLPIYFYGKVKFNSLKGKIIITAPIKRGMVKFGYNLEFIKKEIGVSELKIDGVFVINGSFSTGIDYALIIQKEGILEIGDNSYLGSRTRIVSTKRVVIGQYFRFGFESQILDSTFHFMHDYESNEIRRFNGDVIINDFCWVGNRTTIMKNTITPKYITIASNSLLNKDYTLEVPERSIIGGMPAKLIRDKISRIYDYEDEVVILKYFNSHPGELVYKVSPDFLNDITTRSLDV